MRDYDEINLKEKNMEDKVLCECHNVTLNDVKQKIKEGVTSFQELQELTKLGTDCPSCKDQNEELFKHLIEQK